MILVYDFEIVGGAFDGAPALAWKDDGAHPPPERIFVGVCDKGVDCGTSKCKKSVAHVSYWTVDEDRPRSAKPYKKQHEHVARDDAGDLHGRATYAVGGLLNPKNFEAKAKEPVPA